MSVITAPKAQEILLTPLKQLNALLVITALNTQGLNKLVHLHLPIPTSMRQVLKLSAASASMRQVRAILPVLSVMLA